MDLITDNGAKTLNVTERYGIEIGKPANFIILEGNDDVNVIQRQGEVLWSVRAGEVLISRQPSVLTKQVKLTD